MDISKLRSQIDRADDMLLTSFATRMRLTASIAEEKKKNGIPVEDPEREKEKLGMISKAAPSDIEEECVKLYNTILEISKEYQSKLIDK